MAKNRTARLDAQNQCGLHLARPVLADVKTLPRPLRMLGNPACSVL